MSVTLQNLTFITPEGTQSFGQLKAEGSVHDTVDLSDCLLLPSAIDLSFRFSGRHGAVDSLKKHHEAVAARCAGFAQICVPPDTAPILDTPAQIDLIQQTPPLEPHQPQAARILPIGALTRGLQQQHLSDYDALLEEGCMAFSMADQAIANTQLLKNIFEYAASRNITVMLHPVDSHLSSGCAHDSGIADIMGLPGISSIAETAELAKILIMAEKTQVRLHVQHLSSAFSVDLIAQAKHKGLNITADVDMAHLTLSEMDITDYNTHAKMWPVLRADRDQKALISGVKNGVIDAITSHHVPVSLDSKLLPFEQASFGASTFDTFWFNVLKLHQDHDIPWSRLIDATYSQPCRLVGNDHCIPWQDLSQHWADLDWIALNPDEWTAINTDYLSSRSKLNPYIGWELPGKRIGTLQQGTWQSG